MTLSRSRAVNESGTLFCEGKMPGTGGHRFEFVDREPLVLRVVAMLLFVNTFLGLLLDFGAKYFFPKASMSLPACDALAQGQYHAPQLICWFESRWIVIQFILLALGA